MELPTNYLIINHMYNNLTVYNKENDVKLLLVHSNTWTQLNECNQIIDLKQNY